LKRVGLTGNIASGKSSVAEVWRSLGAHVIDADGLARQAIEPGTPGFEAVVSAFGPAVIQGGRIDRPALRRIVFADSTQRRTLESIVHPEVARLRRDAERELEAAGAALVVNDIPLLFETGMQNDFDAVVLVDAPEDTRVERMVSTRGLSEEAARQMVAAQMPAAQKRAHATYVIDNDASLEALQSRARVVWAQLNEDLA
jgi:dephospho-CoA kinase